MTTTMAVKVDEETRDRLKSLGKIKQRSPHWLMCEAIREYIEKEEVIAARNREADEAWNEYKRTGKGFGNETIMEWLDTWGTGQVGSCPSMEQN